MKNKYQIEYEQSNDCFWAKEPAKFVKLFVNKYCNDLNHKTVLDLGAGEGKNAVYIAAKGAIVIAVDLSPIALSRFCLQPNYNLARDKIKVYQQNIMGLDFENGSFDVIIAYGILHCLSSKKEVETMIERIKRWLVPNGHFICTTFTDEIAPPYIQSYLEYDSFLKKGQIEGFFKKWQVLEHENDIITETHPTTKIEHQHSLVRLIAKKIENE